MLRRSKKSAQICSLVGTHLIMAPITFLWNYGNLAEYMDSYFHYQCSPRCLDGDYQWILTLYLTLFGLGLFVVEPMRKIVGLLWTGIITLLLQNGALFLSAWAIGESVIAVSVLMGVVMGLAGGATMNVAFIYINLWAPKNEALYLGTVTAWPPLLSILQNQIITLYINPENLTPDANNGPKVYFSQPQILERVPGAIIVLAIMSTALQVIGFLFISNPPVKLPAADSLCKNDLSPEDVSQENKISDVQKTKPQKACLNHEMPINQFETDGKDPRNYGTTDCVTDNSATVETENGVSQQNKTVHDSTENGKSGDTVAQSYTPSQAIKTTSFWALWLFGVSVGLGLLLKDSFYKQFGLLYIPNDRLLTLLGSLIPLVVCTSRTIFGGSIKRGLIDVKDALVLSLSLNSVTCAFWYFAPQVNEALYMILILSMAFSHSFLHVVAGTGTLRAFGDAHFATLYSMVYSGASIIPLVSAAYVTPVLHTAGWFWVFLSCAMISLVALAFAVFTKHSVM
ncbi:oxalate:formate antiporter-like isoform x1 [Plakobranchus ocellatus]|uniref:Oxalate:formate antiporter-like isoform x1 n=1 Tax=Plakobranchus ocellatus TaxID=259542 RepID=A0AAV4B4Z3_9GAST|nr:oxalate:formate antiporter-like isoform x1 [Plakobranchus ocellatus]